jgi:peptidoglycan/xylan/chitin deacetylase (PgdA/CDA1 family)
MGGLPRRLRAERPLPAALAVSSLALFQRLLARKATDPDFFSSARSFPTEMGGNIEPGKVRGYYFDLRFKAETPTWPPSWLEPRERQLHVGTAQWALGAYERYLEGEGEEWLACALDAGRYLVDDLEQGGPSDGAWLHWMEMPHTYRLRPPWISGMAQGEGASLLVRLHAETGDESFADAARRAMKPLSIPVRSGGVRAMLGGGPFFEEYPTEPPSFVLNGGIFAMWGCYDVGVGLQDSAATQDFEDALDALARNIERWDTGYWSLYDLFPHPMLPNVASSAYHALHITQLRAMHQIAPRRELEETRERFEGYAKERGNGARAFAVKSAFRLVTPRNRMLAHKPPWSESRRGRNVNNGGAVHSLVLCYHAISPNWPSVLAITPERLRQQLDFLVRHGFHGATFSQIAAGEAPAKALAITFDDAFHSVLDHAFPVLSEFGFPGTVFVPTALVGLPTPMSWPGIDKWDGGPHEDELRGMTWDELRRLRDAGWEVASHTRSHPYLPDLADPELYAELTESRETCSRELGEPCRSLAYPYGAVDDRVAHVAGEAGYEAAAALRPGPLDPMRWPRLGVYPVDGSARFRLKVSPVVRTIRNSGAGRALEKARHTSSHPS